MSEFLIKYISTDGSYKPLNPAVDSGYFRTLVLEGVEFTKDNIALVSDLGNVSGSTSQLAVDLMIHKNQQAYTELDVATQVSGSFDFARQITRQVNDILSSIPKEERYISASGQVLFSVSGFVWDTSNSTRDVLVFKNGIHQNLSSDYSKTSGTQIQFFYPLQLNDRVNIRMEQPISNLAIKDFWREYIVTTTSRSIPFSLPYNTGRERLWMFRNGVYLSRTQTLGSLEDRYEEGTPRFAVLGTYAENNEVITAYHMPLDPAYRFYQQVSGTAITVPSYSVASKRLLAFRNGLLMNASGLGDIYSTYTETSSSVVTLGAAAALTDLLSFENLSGITWRQDTLLASGSALNFSSVYALGDKKLLVFRNGILMFNSASLGSAIDRYSESSASGVTLIQSASGEVFTSIYL